MGASAALALNVGAQGGSPSVADTVIWEGIGHGGGGSFLGGGLINPNDPDMVLIGSDTGGVYRTTDAGKTWTPGNLGLVGDLRRGYVILDLAMNPQNPMIVYTVSAAGLFKSESGGQHWTRQAGPMKMVAVAVDSSDSDVVYAADTEARVYRSTDGWATSPATQAAGGIQPCSTAPPRTRPASTSSTPAPQARTASGTSQFTPRSLDT